MLKISLTQKYLIVIGGPTASGKTGLAIHLAMLYKCPIISADSRQIYRELNIGTAKPSHQELSSAEHHMINHISITSSYSVGQYEREVIQLLDELYVEHNHVILVGGTGLYIKAVIEGLDAFPDIPKIIRDEYKYLLQKDGLTSLQKELISLDPQYAKDVDINNAHRIIRALSVIKVSGLPFSHFLKRNKGQRGFSPILISTDLPRQELYKRINQRVDQMLDNGLITEVQGLREFQELNSLNTVGYKEIFKYLNGEWSKEVAVSKIKQHSRNYAKRQITWFKNQQDFTLFNPSDKEKIEHFIQCALQSTRENDKSVRP